MSIRKDQESRLHLMLFRAGEKGLRESQIIYLENRHHGLGEQFTKDTLQTLYDQGVIDYEIEGKRFKTISDKEKNQIIRWRYISHA